MDPPDPFQQRFGPDGSDEAPEEAAPPPDAEEQPRLGIRHLLVWTACTAAYLGVYRSLLVTESPQDSVRAESIVRWVMYGIAGGTAWGGLAIWVARRRRRIPFPVHPGERLLVVLGLNTSVGLLAYLFFVLSYLWASHESPPWGVGGMLGFTVGNAVNTIICLAACRRVRLRMWRVVFLLLAARHAMPCCCTGLEYPYPETFFAMYVPPLIVAAPLAIVALGDLRHHRRFPWTHWTGVALGLWLGAAAAVSVARLLLIGPRP